MKEHPQLSVPEALARLQMLKQMTPVQPPAGPQLALPAQMLTSGVGQPLFAAAAAQHAASKHDREFFCGNVPPDATSADMADFLGAAIAHLAEKTHRKCHSSPVINAWLSGDGHVAFVEARDAKTCSMALELDGLTLQGYTLKIGRPHDDPTAAGETQKTITDQQEGAITSGGPATPVMPVVDAMTANALASAFISVDNVPRHLTAVDIAEALLLPLGPLARLNILRDAEGKSKGTIIAKYAQEKPATAAAIDLLSGLRLGDEILAAHRVPAQAVDILLAPAKRELIPVPAHDPTAASAVLCLRNVANDDDLRDDQLFAELHDEILEECAAYANVESIVVPRVQVSSTTKKIITKLNKERCSGLGLVFVEFHTSDDATKARDALLARSFDQDDLDVHFYPRDLFKKKIFHSDPLPIDYLANSGPPAAVDQPAAAVSETVAATTTTSTEPIILPPPPPPPPSPPPVPEPVVDPPPLQPPPPVPEIIMEDMD